MDSGSVTWVEQVTCAWGGLPVGKLLAEDLGELADQLGGAMAVQAVKYGQSVAIAMPHRGAEPFSALLQTLHFARLITMRGGVASSWMNQANMAGRPYLVVWTRSLKRFRQLSRLKGFEDLRARRCRRGGDLESLSLSGLATLLIDAGDNLLKDLEWLQQSNKVFAFVVDGQVDGLPAQAAAVNEALAAWVPEIPRVTVTTTGQAQEGGVLAQDASGPVWSVRPGDARTLYATTHPTKPIPAQIRELCVVEDLTANRHLEALSKQAYQLEGLAKQGEGANKDRLLKPVRALLRGLRALSVPLPVYEEVLTRHARGGLYPVLPLATWLEAGRDAKWAHGDAQAASRLCLELAKTCLSLFKDAETGRMQLIHHKVGEAIRLQQRLLVLAGTALEAEALFEWLEQSYEILEHPEIHIAAMDGDYGHTPTWPGYDEVVVMGVLWATRMHWLAIPCQRLSVVCLPFEQAMYERQLQGWWGQHGAASPGTGDKLTLWTLGFQHVPRLRDTLPGSAEVHFAATPSVFSGRYVTSPRMREIEHKSLVDDWLDKLTEEAPERPGRATEGTEICTGGQALVFLEGWPHPVSWPLGKGLMVLRGDALEGVTPDGIIPGDEVLFLHEGDERLATQRSLLELFAGASFDYQQCDLLASRWKRDIRKLNADLGKQRLFTKLRAQGLSVGSQAVDNWVRSQVIIGPQNAMDLRVIAQVFGRANPDQYAQHIQRAIETIRQEHRQIGRELRAAILARAAGEQVVKIGPHILGNAELDTLFEMACVERVEMQQAAAPSRSKPSLIMLGEIERAYPTQLKVTSAAWRSLDESPYDDLPKLRRALEFMAVTLHGMLAGQGGKPEDVVQQASDLQITYAPNSAPHTMGRYKDQYVRTYHGEQVKIGAHIGLGNARDPAKTLRIHYHFDDVEKKLVLHHIGKHLPTLSS